MEENIANNPSEVVFKTSKTPNKNQNENQNNQNKELNNQTTTM